MKETPPPLILSVDARDLHPGDIILCAHARRRRVVRTRPTFIPLHPDDADCCLIDRLPAVEVLHARPDHHPGSLAYSTFTFGAKARVVLPEPPSSSSSP